MQTTLYEHLVLPSAEAAPSQPATARRLLGITLALRLSGAPPLDAADNILLARYVAGHLPLSDIIPALWRD